MYLFNPLIRISLSFCDKEIQASIRQSVNENANFKRNCVGWLLKHNNAESHFLGMNWQNMGSTFEEIVHPTPGIWNLLIFCRSFWAIQPRSSRDDRSPKTTVLAWTAPLPASRDTTGWQFSTISSPTKSYCPSQKQGAPHQCNCKRWQRLVCDIDILKWVFFFNNHIHFMPFWLLYQTSYN